MNADFKCYLFNVFELHSNLFCKPIPNFIKMWVVYVLD